MSQKDMGYPFVEGTVRECFATEQQNKWV